MNLGFPRDLKCFALLPSCPNRNYEIYDKEMLAVIRGLENWRHIWECKIQVWDLDRL